MKYLPLIFALAFCSCAHVAKHYDAPDSAPLRKSIILLGQDVADAKAGAALASNAVGAAKASSARETAAIALLGPKVADLERLGPVELRPDIEAIKADLETLTEAHAETVVNINDAGVKQGALMEVLEKANADDNEMKNREVEYAAKVDALTAHANKSESELATASKSLWWYRLHWWGAWIVLALGILACGLLAFLKLTGRLALAGAKL